MKKNIIFIVCLVFVLGVNIYFRAFPIYFPQLREHASKILEENIRQRAFQEVYSKFPQYDPLAKERLVKEKIAGYKKFSKKGIAKQVDDLYFKLKDRYQNDTGQTYLMELDCWHWARYVDNVVRFGHPGDEVIYGKQWDRLMLAPFGDYMDWTNFLFYFSAFLYKIFSIIRGVSLFNFLFYLPLFFTFCLLTVLYLFSYRLGGNIAAVVSCLFLGLAPITLQRSCAGWFDKDILNLLFPLLVIWAYLIASNRPSLKPKLFWICLSSFWVGLFCFNWTNWWFIFLLVIIYEVVSLFGLALLYYFRKLKEQELIKQHSISLAAFLSFSIFWIIIFSGIEPFRHLWLATKQALVLTKPIAISIWPNVYATVGELRRVGFVEMANSIGDKFAFIASVISVLILLLRAFTSSKFKNFKREAVVILVIWLLVMGYACSKGIRFAIFLLIPLGISLGWVLNDIYEGLRKRRKILSHLIIIVLVLFSGLCLRNANRAAKTLFPLMDDTWFALLNMTREKTTQETILNSWWDFGDWFKAVANRRVIFDGQSQDRPQAYWMAKALLSNNEQQSLGILRMLNNGGNKAFEIINQYIKDDLQSILLLESIIVFNPDKAREALLQFLPPDATDEVIKLLFARPAKACFIVDPSMQFKIVAISYLGNWDFSKVYMAQNLNKKEKEQIIEHLKKLGRDPQQMQNLYQEAFLIESKDLDSWISKRLNFYSGLTGGREKDGLVYFDNGFTYNPQEQIIYSNSGQIPRSLFVPVEGKMREIGFQDANVRFSVLVVKAKEGYACVLLDRELANSLFSRLYFFNGAGSRYFSPFINSEEGGNYIRVFKIEW